MPIAERGSRDVRHAPRARTAARGYDVDRLLTRRGSSELMWLGGAPGRWDRDRPLGQARTFVTEDCLEYASAGRSEPVRHSADD